MKDGMKNDFYHFSKEYIICGKNAKQYIERIQNSCRYCDMLAGHRNLLENE